MSASSETCFSYVYAICSWIEKSCITDVLWWQRRTGFQRFWLEYYVRYAGSTQIFVYKLPSVYALRVFGKTFTRFEIARSCVSRAHTSMIEVTFNNGFPINVKKTNARDHLCGAVMYYTLFINQRKFLNISIRTVKWLV